MALYGTALYVVQHAYLMCGIKYT